MVNILDILFLALSLTGTALVYKSVFTISPFQIDLLTASFWCDPRRVFGNPDAAVLFIKQKFEIVWGLFGIIAALVINLIKLIPGREPLLLEGFLEASLLFLGSIFIYSVLSVIAVQVSFCVFVEIAAVRRARLYQTYEDAGEFEKVYRRFWEDNGAFVRKDIEDLFNCVLIGRLYKKRIPKIMDRYFSILERVATRFGLSELPRTA